MFQAWILRSCSEEREEEPVNHITASVFFIHHDMFNNKFHSCCFYGSLTLKCTVNGVYWSWGVLRRPPTGLCWLTWCHPSWKGRIALSGKKTFPSEKKTNLQHCSRSLQLLWVQCRMINRSMTGRNVFVGWCRHEVLQRKKRPRDKCFLCRSF